MRLQAFLNRPNKSKPLLLRQVSGLSMLPVLKPGKIVVATAWFRTVKPGNVVIIVHDGIEKIKRVQYVSPDAIYLLGDNADSSTDSRQFGWLPRGVVKAKVLLPRG